MTKEEIKKAVQEVVQDLKSDDNIEKGLNNEASNGGDDSIKSGTPKTETQELMSKKKEMKKSEDETEMTDEEKAKKEEEKVEKSEEVVEKSEETPKEEVFKGLVAQDDEENELLKAWRENKDAAPEEIELSKSVKEEVKEDESLAKALSAQKEENDELRKSISESNELIKSLTEKVEKMASQPAYDKKSVDSLEPIEKSEEAPAATKPSKGQVLNALLDLQQEGIAKSHDVIKYQSTSQLSKPLQEAVKDKLTKSLK